MREKNIRMIRQNSITIFLRRDISLLPKDGRPVSQANDLNALFEKRLPFYKKTADYEIEVVPDPDENVKKIKETLGL